MPDTIYTLNSNDKLSRHGRQPATFFNDLETGFSPDNIEAMVDSNDLFVMLATEVERLIESLHLKPGDEPHNDLKQLTNVLLYLQLHYRLRLKRHGHRR